MTFLDALEADRTRNIEAAAVEYEAALIDDFSNLPMTVNLLVLYWQATDYGFSLANRLPKEFMAKSGTRLAQLIEGAKQRFPGRPEAFFWTKYIAWADLGDAFEAGECRALLEEYPDYLEPAMLLFSLTRGVEAVGAAKELLNRCHEDGTTRSRYVASVIEGGLHRKTFEST